MTENTRKTRLGHLYKRTTDGQTIPADDPRHGTYWLQYAIGGKRFRKSLGTKNRKKADAERKKIMAPIAVASEKEELERTATRLQATDERLESLQVEQRDLLLIENTWQAYLRSPSRPDPSERTLGDYAGYFRRFQCSKSMWNCTGKFAATPRSPLQTGMRNLLQMNDNLFTSE